MQGRGFLAKYHLIPQRKNVGEKDKNHDEIKKGIISSRTDISLAIM